jgi:hypothetical protein
MQIATPTMLAGTTIRLETVKNEPTATRPLRCTEWPFLLAEYAKGFFSAAVFNPPSAYLRTPKFVSPRDSSKNSFVDPSERIDVVRFGRYPSA